ncbi:hypothetical protein Aperf_G00000088254 [Anoplocephala perfoliata]
MELPNAHGSRPFYLTPTKRPTPGAIVKECRDWLQTIATCRPLTPPLSETRRCLDNSFDSDSPPSTASSIDSQIDCCDAEATRLSSLMGKGANFKKHSLLGANTSVLAKICKIIYRFAKDATNDVYFVENVHSVNIFSTILNGLNLNFPAALSAFNDEKIIKTLEGLLYCCGSLKFLARSNLSGETFAQPFLLKQLRHIYEWLCDLMFIIHSCPQKEECDALLETVYHVLLQITEIFCSLSHNDSADKLKRLFADTGIFHAILKSLSRFAPADLSLNSEFTDIHQVKLNLSRIILHLSEYEYFCSLIAEENESKHFKDILDFVFSNQDFPNIVLRLVYALGNAATSFQSARNALFATREGALKICKLGYRFAALLSTEIQNSQIIDVLIKLTRFITNACIGIDVELLTPAMPGLIQLLLSFSKISRPFSEVPIQELLHNSLAGLNNITFYMNIEEHPELMPIQINVAKECLRLFCEFSADEQVCLSSVRILANIARRPEGRKAILTLQSVNSGHNFLLNRLLILIQSQHYDTVCASLGLLVNLVLESKFLAMFIHSGGLLKMSELLRIKAGEDWRICSLAGQVICNSIISANEVNAHHSSSPTLESETQEELKTLLLPLTDEKHIDQMIEDANQNFELAERSREELQNWKSMWEEEFFPVASHLLSLLMKD